MGSVESALHQRCASAECATAAPGICTSDAAFEGWLADEFVRAFAAHDLHRIRELVKSAPVLRERELSFPGEASKLTALAMALNRRDVAAVGALLDAGVSPNLPISAEQRSIYAHRSQLAALNGGDPDIQHMTPTTHFEALCCVQHKELFFLLLEKGASPSSGILQVCHCGDAEMLAALLSRGADPNLWKHSSSSLVTSVKSKLEPYEKALQLLRAAADPNLMGNLSSNTDSRQRLPYPALTLAVRKRDYRTVRILLEAGADVNTTVGDEGLPNVLFWATYWGELELVKLFVTLSRRLLDLSMRKYTGETVFDVASTSRCFAASRKPRHIAKLPLPSRPAVVYEKIAALLEEYRRLHPEASAGASGSLATGSTTATTTRRQQQPWSGNSSGRSQKSHNCSMDVED